MRARLMHRLRSFALLIRDPAAWSARRYGEQAMHFAAVRPETWKKP